MNALFALRTVLDLRNEAIGLARHFDRGPQSRPRDGIGIGIDQHSLIGFFNFCVTASVLSNFVRDGGKAFPERYQWRWAIAGAISGLSKIYEFVSNERGAFLTTEQKVIRLWSIFVDALAVGLCFVPKSPLKEGLQMAYLSACLVKDFKDSRIT